MAFSIKQYSAKDKEAWNSFLETSKNGTFLLHRNYMDYHSDRFKDFSLMVYKDETLYAILPANRDNTTFFSHQGLTYGGLITNTKATANDICQTFTVINDFLKKEGIIRVIYKPIPWIYQQYPAEEDLYAIFKECNAQLIVRNISSTVIQNHTIKWNRDRHYGANKAQNDGIVVKESNDFSTFWEILEDNLMHTYQARPVHTLSEMQLLKQRFPEQIRLYAAYQEGTMLGGTLLYVTPQVVHAQYISATPQGKHKHAIDALFRKLLKDTYSNYPYFDFGTSNENQGKVLNTSLIYQKEGFGGRAVCYDTYEWTL